MCVACVQTWVLYWVCAVRPFVANMANAVTTPLRVYEREFRRVRDVCNLRCCVCALCVCLGVGLVAGLSLG